MKTINYKDFTGTWELNEWLKDNQDVKILNIETQPGTHHGVRLWIEKNI